MTAQRVAMRQRAELTFKGNRGFSRHDWLRLTPAYSVRLVADVLDDAEQGARVFDPFGGSGTTALLAAERGHDVTSIDLNPFLVWFARVKTATYREEDLLTARDLAETCVAAARRTDAPSWLPPLANIERWWKPGSLAALGRLRAALDTAVGGPARDLLLVAFARAMIADSNAAFNHQSMSFRTQADTLWAEDVLSLFIAEVEHVASSATTNPTGAVAIAQGDARRLEGVASGGFDVLCSSPPYANRMSYVRELRPYMYWLGFLETAREAGELDWEAIGGTWGIATSRVAEWNATNGIPLDGEFGKTIAAISNSNEKSGELLSRYVTKYFHDIWEHVQVACRVMAAGGSVVYVVGNSMFRGVHVPTHKWYAELLTAAGFEDAQISVLRKRNSNKALYEYAISARRAST